MLIADRQTLAGLYPYMLWTTSRNGQLSPKEYAVLRKEEVSESRRRENLTLWQEGPSLTAWTDSVGGGPLGSPVPYHNTVNIPSRELSRVAFSVKDHGQIVQSDDD